MNIFILSQLLFVFNSCLINTEDDIIKKTKNEKCFQYAVFGHTYLTNELVDERVETMELSKFDQLWLGGDMCAETTKEYATIQYLDQIFDLSNPGTHWSVGNHDVRNGNLNWIIDATQKPLYYVEKFNNITLMVINTTEFFYETTVEEGRNAQYEMIKTACEDINDSEYLFFFSHRVVWSNADGYLQGRKVGNDGGAGYLALRYDPNQNFNEAILPLLIDVQRKGIQVICVAGDFGQRENFFEHKDNEGIIYLGSGLLSNSLYNQQFPAYGFEQLILIFEQDKESLDISWKFHNLDSLSANL